MYPVPHRDTLPTNVATNNWRKLPILDEAEANCMECLSASSDPSYIPRSFQEPHLPKQSEQCINLSEPQKKLLGSRPGQRNLLAAGERISVFRKKRRKIWTFYGMQDSLCVCLDRSGLKEQLGFEHKVEECRLFTDSSEAS